MKRSPFPPIILPILIALLLGSWYYPPSRIMWDQIDAHIFFFCNGLIMLGEGSKWLWAIANYRAFDLVPACLMLALLLLYLRQQDAFSLAHKTSVLLFIVLYCVLTIQMSHAIFDLKRISPSLTLEPVWRLSELVPEIKSKDASGRSFPGDHGTVLLLISYMLWHLRGIRVGVTAMLVTAIFILPRLVSGAHWGTDILVGSISIASAAYLIAFYTPIFERAVQMLEPVCGWVLRITLLRRIAAYALKSNGV